MQDAKLLKSLRREIVRFRRIVCLQQLARAFRSPFSARPQGSAAAVHVPSVALIMA